MLREIISNKTSSLAQCPQFISQRQALTFILKIVQLRLVSDCSLRRPYFGKECFQGNRSRNERRTCVTICCQSLRRIFSFGPQEATVSVVSNENQIPLVE